MPWENNEKSHQRHTAAICADLIHHATTKWALTIDSTCTSSSQLLIGVVRVVFLLLDGDELNVFDVESSISSMIHISHVTDLLCEFTALFALELNLLCLVVCLVNSITIRYVRLIKTPLYLLSQLCLTEQQFSRRLEGKKMCLICLMNDTEHLRNGISHLYRLKSLFFFLFFAAFWLTIACDSRRRRFCRCRSAEIIVCFSL